jgi:hypothetical protein
MALFTIRSESSSENQNEIFIQPAKASWTCAGKSLRYERERILCAQNLIVQSGA